MQHKESEYKLIKGNAGEGELEQYRLSFLKDGTNRSINNLQWLHHHNLLVRNEIYYAMHQNSIAAIYTALPVALRIEGKLYPALQSIDTLTDIDHRGKGLFIKLANLLYNDAAAGDYKLVYGFPNPNSAPGFFKKLQWKAFGEAPFMLQPLNPFYFLKKILKRKKQPDFSSSNHVFDAPVTTPLKGDAVMKKIDAFNSDYDVIWNKAAATIGICVNRDAAYMNWRYVQKPDEHYYRYALYRNGTLAGVVVFAVKHKHDGLIGYLMELIYDPAHEEDGKQLLRFASRLCKKEKTDVLLAWCTPHAFNYRAFKNSGFYNLPEKIRPQQLFLGARVFDHTIENLVYDQSKWYFSYSDSDTA